MLLNKMNKAWFTSVLPGYEFVMDGCIVQIFSLFYIILSFISKIQKKNQFANNSDIYNNWAADGISLSKIRIVTYYS